MILDSNNKYIYIVLFNVRSVFFWSHADKSQN